MDREEYGKMLREAYFGTFIGIIVCVCIVMGIFYSSKVSYEIDLKKQEQRARELEMRRNPTIAAWTYENIPEYWQGIFLSEYREVVKMEPGVEYIAGQLRELDRELFRATNFPYAAADNDDEARWYYPPLTFNYQNFLHIESSLHNDWLTVGPTDKVPKTGEYLYYPKESENSDGWGKGMVSVFVPVNGEFDEKYADGKNNLILTERLGDVYENVPEQFADRERKVYVYHIFATAYNEDPHDKKSKNPTPVTTLTVCVKCFGQWDIGKDELSMLKIDDYNFTPHMTVEIVK